MSEVVVVKIDVQDQDAQASVDALTKKYEEQTKELAEINKKLAETEKNTADAAKGTGGLAKGFKAVGTAFKAMGIGLVVALLAKMADVLSQNEKVMDFVNTSMTTMEIVFNDLFSFIGDNFLPMFEKVKTFFSELTFADVGEAIKNNIIERFQSMLDMFGYVGDAIKALIDRDWDAMKTAVKEAGKEFVDMGTGVDGTVDKVVDGTTKMINSATEYGKKVVENAEKTTRLNKNAEEAAAIQAGLVEQYDRQAEQLRQIRDDESISIAERMKANDELSVVLQNQEDAMLKQADLQTAAAANQLAINNNQENRIALIDAETNAAGVLAQVEGFRSEQLVNQVALEKEALELLQSGSEAENQLAIDRARYNAEQIQNTADRLIALRSVLDKEKEIELERLQFAIDSASLGTQAKVDAEAEFNAKKEEFRQADIELDKQAEEAKRAEAEKTANFKIQKDEAALAIAQAVFGIGQNLAKEGSDTAKGFAVAQALINTYQGITAELATKTVTPWEFGLKLANIASVASIGFSSVRKILSTDKNSRGGGVSTGGGGTRTAPSYNIIGSTPATNDAVNNTTEAVSEANLTPIKAYTVSTDMTSQQQLDREAEENSGI